VVTQGWPRTGVSNQGGIPPREFHNYFRGNWNHTLTDSNLRNIDHLKPNSITLACSELVRCWFEAGSCQIPLH